MNFQKIEPIYCNFFLICVSLMMIGGVRLEDNVLITSDSYYNFTFGVRTIEDVTKIMKEGSITTIDQLWRLKSEPNGEEEKSD